MDKKEIKPKKAISAKPRETKPAAHHPASHTAPIKPERYFEGVGRRKTSVARVRISKGDGRFNINGRQFDKYFQANRLRNTAEEPLKRLNIPSLDVSVKIQGGGITAQAEAVRHGIARALVLMKPETKPQLATLGFLTRDPRMVERKKYGLRKARRAPQWKKR